MSTSSSSTSGGIGFCGLLTILFIALKLLDKIDWSWWWVLSPIWLPISIILAIILALILIFGLVKFIIWLVYR